VMVHIDRVPASTTLGLGMNHFPSYILFHVFYENGLLVLV